MLAVAKTRRVQFFALVLSEKVKRSLPIWHHLGRDKTQRILHNGPTARCLQDNHKVLTVGDMISFLDHNEEERHTDCKICEGHRECENATSCKEAGIKMIVALKQKWSPSDEQPEERAADVLDEKDVTESAKRDIIITELKNCFRIFVHPDDGSDTAPINPGEKDNRERPVNRTVWYTDGSCINNGHENATAGAGVWKGRNDPENEAIRLPDYIKQTSSAGEAVGILRATQKSPNENDIETKTDSQSTLETLTTRRKEAEDQDWIGYENPELLQATIGAIRSRPAKTYLTKVKGHSGEEGNEGADELAGEGARREDATPINTYVPRVWRLSGALLPKMTQSLAYQGILRDLRQSTSTERRTTKINLDITRHAVRDRAEILPSDSEIWRSTRSTKIQNKKVRNFLFKAIHGIHKCGQFWENIPGYEHRARCPKCDCDETLEHILTECRASGQETIWRLANQLLGMKNIEWRDKSIGSILGCGISNWKTEDGQRRPGADRLFTMIVSASAYLIWCIRCDWRIEKECNDELIQPTHKVHNTWLQTINEILKLDIQSSYHTNIKGATNPKQVRATWSGVLRENEIFNLQDNPRWNPEVLVGIEPLVRPRVPRRIEPPDRFP